MRLFHRVIFSPVFGSLLLAGATIAAVEFFPGKQAAAAKSLLAIEPSPSYVCDEKQGTVVIAEFMIQNLSPDSIKLLGATTSCGCTTVPDEFPIEVLSGGKAKVHVRVAVGVPGIDGNFTKTAQLLVNHAGSVPPLVVNVHILKS